MYIIINEQKFFSEKNYYLLEAQGNQFKSLTKELSHFSYRVANPQSAKGVWLIFKRRIPDQ